jgi:hypothetical protein
MWFEMRYIQDCQKYMNELILIRAKLLYFVFFISKGLDGMSLQANKKSDGQRKK